jgi:ribosomal protein L11 methyltransferase
MGEFLVITCQLPASVEGELAEAMCGWPVLGCQVQDAGGGINVTVYLDEAHAPDLPQVAGELTNMGASGLASGHFARADWLAEYRRAVTPQRIGSSFWVDPHPAQRTPAPEKRIHLLIEPRQAFGTGSHESTQLILLALEELPVTGARVLDAGTGSGILAIASSALGASRVVAFDIDLEAVFVARQTIAVQPQRVDVRLFAGTATALRRRACFDVVLANVIPAQLEPILAALRALLAPDGRLVISGVLADQRAAFISELAGHSLAVVRERELGEWVALVCRPVETSSGPTAERRGATPAA